jgi:hypothetical protein
LLAQLLFLDARLADRVHIINESFNPDQRNPEGTKSQRKFLQALAVFIKAALILAIALGAYPVFQSRDLWLDTQSKSFNSTDHQATSTAACETFITEFPGHPALENLTLARGKSIQGFVFPTFRLERLEPCFAVLQKT